MIKNSVEMMWIEYMFAPKYKSDRVYELLLNDFMVFDTEFLFRGAPSKDALKVFEVSKTGKKLSNGQVTWTGFKKLPWNNFKEESVEFVEKFRLIQTDLCCVKRQRPCIDRFLKALLLLGGKRIDEHL